MHIHRNTSGNNISQLTLVNVCNRHMKIWPNEERDHEKEYSFHQTTAKMFSSIYYCAKHVFHILWLLHCILSSTQLYLHIRYIAVDFIEFQTLNLFVVLVLWFAFACIIYHFSFSIQRFSTPHIGFVAKCNVNV